MPGPISAHGEDGDSVNNTPLLARLANLFSPRYALSVGAQAMVSGFHFALNLMLLRLITPYDYGIFAFAFVLALFAAAINNALISTPLTVYTPVIKDNGQRREQETMFSNLNVLLFLLLVSAGVLYAQLTHIATDITLSATLFVAVYAARQYSRSVGYARMRPLVTATGDMSYVLAGALLLSIVVAVIDVDLSVTHVLLSLAGANLIAMFIERWRIHGWQHGWLKLARIRDYGHVWEQSRWALLGALTTLFLGQAHGLVITWADGPQAFAPLAAGMVLFGPVRVALLTWQNMVKPEMAVALSEQRTQEVRQQILRTAALMILAVLALALLLAFAWPVVHKLLYAKQYSDQPMAYIVGLWALITICAASYNPAAAALQAMRDFRVLAMASVYGAVISGVLVALLLYVFNPESTLFAILAAELFMAVYLSRIIMRQLQATQ